LLTILSRLSKREKLILYAAAALISLAFLDRLLLRPILLKMKEIDKKIEQQKTTIKKNLRILTQKERILNEGNKYASYSIEAPSSEEEVSLLKNIESLASESLIHLVAIKPIGSGEEEASKKYGVSLDCEAQMERIADFMYRVESSSDLLKVEKFNISQKAKESDIVKCSISVSKIVIH